MEMKGGHAKTIAINAITECKSCISSRNITGANRALEKYRDHATIAGIFDQQICDDLLNQIASIQK